MNANFSLELFLNYVFKNNNINRKRMSINSNNKLQPKKK